MSYCLVNSFCSQLWNNSPDSLTLYWIYLVSLLDQDLIIFSLKVLPKIVGVEHVTKVFSCYFSLSNTVQQCFPVGHWAFMLKNSEHWPPGNTPRRFKGPQTPEFSRSNYLLPSHWGDCKRGLCLYWRSDLTAFVGLAMFTYPRWAFSKTCLAFSVEGIVVSSNLCC